MRGFSLVELLVAMAIAGLLAALALPGYSHVMHRARRQDARIALLRLQHHLEVHFASHRSYGPRMDQNPPAMPERSELGYYLLELHVSADGMSYTAMARADPAGVQAADSRCTWLAVDETGRRQNADLSRRWRDNDPYRCWG